MLGLSNLENGVRREYHKWDYITLSDFRSGSFGNIMSYGWLWLMSMISISVYVADTFTAVNLLAFDKWSSEFQPTIPIAVAKWIFAGCILLSWLLLIYEWVIAIKTIGRNSVVKDYLDPLAATLQSQRIVGQNGYGWRRFLVFAELTKSKKGTDYIALFVYFQFKGAFRILLAEGPRQVVNALTLFSLMFQQLDGKDAGSDIKQFWFNMEALARDHREQAVILWSMAFTFIIWAFSFICFLSSCVLYVGFLWHYIPASDGSLSRYCRRKIEKRLEKMVSAKVEETMRKQKEKQRKEEEKLRREEEKRTRDEGKKKLKAASSVSTTSLPVRPQPQRQPTLPTLGGKDEDDTNSMSSTPNRSDSQAKPPSYRPTTRNRAATPDLKGEPTLPDLSEDVSAPPPLSRTFTGQSGISHSSYASDKPLLHDSTRQPTTLPLRRPVPRQTFSSQSTSTWMSEGQEQSLLREGYTASPELMRNDSAAGPRGAYSRPPGPPRNNYNQAPFPDRPGTSNSNRSLAQSSRPGTANSYMPRAGPPRLYPQRMPTSASDMPYAPQQDYGEVRMQPAYGTNSVAHSNEAPRAQNRWIPEDNANQSWNESAGYYEMQPPQRAWTPQQASQPQRFQTPGPAYPHHSNQINGMPWAPTQDQPPSHTVQPSSQYVDADNFPFNNAASLANQADTAPQRVPEYTPPSYQPLHPPPVRSMTANTAPPAHYAAPPQGNTPFRQEFQPEPIRRAGTAPPGAPQSTPYDMSVIDAYAADGSNGFSNGGWRPPPRRALPNRPGMSRQ